MGKPAKRPIDVDDVVRITETRQTGVVIRTKPEQEPPHLCIVLKGEYIGIWYNIYEVRRISSLRARPKQLELPEHWSSPDGCHEDCPACKDL